LRRLLYKLISCLLIAAVVPAAQGLVWAPGEQPEAGGRTDEAYPCEGHGCGCMCSAACRSHCCCCGLPHAQAMTGQRGDSGGGESARPPGKRLERSGHLEIRAPECGGQRDTLGFDVVVWRLDLGADWRHDLPLILICPVESGRIPDSLNISPVPPPPKQAMAA
jgi:hypothetical protein